ncbi:MAG: DNA polymerase III subunit gamma/tau [Legionellales bacterium]|jgi:DNA polymerase-3 subunit gamma/tau
MSYQVLARKWRPQNFTEMVGQNHVLRALVNALDNQQLHHAYLFTGTRGVGKTTIARILAKSLNCETGITSKPCGTCSACMDIRDGKFVDLIEVDAASRTKVEQTRDLLENVAYAPTRGRFKIYLIDEVHMLSTHSFNALLKTLEEPPEHVKFLLATTDPDRLPMTVLSRCLHFHLKNMSVETISRQLAHILTQEKITFEPMALDLLAFAAQGSMRDSLSLLDQAIAYGAGQVNVAQVRELLGHIDPQIVLHILQALKDQQGDLLLTTIQGEQPQVILDELIQALHHIAVMQLVSARAAEHAELKPFADYFSAQDIQLFYQIAVNGRRDLPWVANQQLGLEMILLRMLAFTPVSTGSREPVAERKIEQVVKNKIEPTATLEKKATAHSWADIAPNLGLSGLAMALASHCVLISQEEHLIQLALAPQHAPLLNTSSTQRLCDAVSTYYGRKINVKINLEETGEETPALAQAQKQAQAQTQAEEGIKTDPQVQAMMASLGASIINDSIIAR